MYNPEGRSLDRPSGLLPEIQGLIFHVWIRYFGLQYF
jgi:hypothetical protein